MFLCDSRLDYSFKPLLHSLPIKIDVISNSLFLVALIPPFTEKNSAEFNFIRNLFPSALPRSLKLVWLLFIHTIIPYMNARPKHLTKIDAF